MRVTMHTLAEAEIAVADAVLIAAYPEQRSRAAELRRYLRLEPEGWFVARDEQQGIVGVGGVVVYDTFAYVGLIGVLPSWQRQGIGKLIMRHLLDWLAAQGCPVALLDASPMGRPMYEKLGFVAEDQSEVWLASKATMERGSSADGVHTLDAHDLGELVAFDAPRFGADRAKVLAALLGEYPGRLLATRDPAGNLTGYALAQPQSIGPFIADSPTVAEQLLRDTLMLPFEQPPTVLMPAINAEATALLARWDFAKQRALTYMRLGDLALSRRREAQYGLASFALG